jgi:hypothetical protein
MWDWGRSFTNWVCPSSRVCRTNKLKLEDVPDILTLHAYIVVIDTHSTVHTLHCTALHPEAP